MYTPDALVKLAVQDIVSNINSGLTPQEATTKVAKELALNHNFIKRASEAVNIALHHNHFKKNPEAKADDFLTVDAQKAAEDIYGVKEKTASEYRSELFSSFQMPDEVAPKFAKYLEDGPYKEAYAKFVLADKITKTATSEQGIYERSHNYISKLKKQAFEAEGDRLDMEFQVDKAFCDILRKFAEDNMSRSSWDAFETGVFSKYGESSVKYLDLLYKASKLNEERGKHDANVKLAEICPEVDLYVNFMTCVTKLAEATVRAEESEHNFKFENDYLKQAYQTRGCELTKNSEEEDRASLLEKIEASIKAEKAKIASADPEDPVLTHIIEKKAAKEQEFDDRIKNAIDLMGMGGDTLKDFTQDEGKANLSASTNTPESNRERAIMLQELITTDPIISKFPTHHTVDAYQQLLRIAPELSSEKEITRAFLRQAGASQAINPFEAEQLIKANTHLFKQHQLQKGMNPPTDYNPQ
jgi:hypothetical protein